MNTSCHTPYLSTQLLSPLCSQHWLISANIVFPVWADMELQLWIVSLVLSGFVVAENTTVDQSDIDYDLTGESDTVIEESDSKYPICDVCACDEHDSGPMYLDCSSMQLNIIPEGVGEIAKNLSLVGDFSHNNLNNISGFSNLEVWELNFSHNKIRTIGRQAFANISRDLLHLDLGDNKIRTSGLNNESFAKDLMEDDTPFALIDLSLTNNHIHSLPPLLFSQLGNLEDLDLSFNPIDQMDDNTSTAIGSVASLHYLNLRECQLGYLPAQLLSGLTQLLRLDISGNFFTTVDPRIQLAGSLISLSLDNNHIQVLDHSSFEGLGNIRNLSVSENLYLSTVEKDTFTPLLSLEELRIIKNPSLTWIHPEAWPTNEDNLEVMFQVKVLMLSENNLRYLPSMLLPTFSNWDDIQMLDIQGNPWWCDCHNEWMVSTLVKMIQANTPELTPGITCAGPPKTTVVKEEMMVVSELSSHDLPCDTLQFNPWRKDFNIPNPNNYRAVGDSPDTTVHGLAAGVALTCLVAVCATAGLVFVLYRQQQKRRRLSAMRFSRVGPTPQAGYVPAPKQVVVRTQFGLGIVNEEFQDEEAEMKEIRTVQGWPPALEGVQD